ncbi:hypothetical protein [Silvanigrella aquatica]|uniref:Uncharacterized protein n=1 Tax=Silvanigrella aquatica TaxID=1915309 RepID=A0A1L4D3H5_9BACT|nr:hypothetical protein [Silvanigrella aquatica]APJ04750.1 hypothetical protein AXG55_12925 [Silvanigrella aquatica]
MAKNTFKIKDNILLSRGIQLDRTEESVHRCFLFAFTKFEEEEFDTEAARMEATKVVFGFPNDFINGSTIAQWLATGGDERRAIDAIKDYIIEAKRIKAIEKEVKTITARVFRSGS